MKKINELTGFRDPNACEKEFIGQYFDKIGKANKIIFLFQAVPVGQRIKHAGKRGVQLKENIHRQRRRTKQQQADILLSCIFHSSNPPWEKGGQESLPSSQINLGNL